MKYKMNVVVIDPNTKDGMSSMPIMYKVNCYFHYDEDGYGKKTYLSMVTDDNRFEHYIDLRYDKDYHIGKEGEYLVHWAHCYWSGKNGAWAVKDIEVTKV